MTTRRAAAALALAASMSCSQRDFLARARSDASPADGGSLPAVDYPGDPIPAGVDRVVFPTGSGVIDVKARYGARGDGVADDTAALQRAVRENVGRTRVLHLPEGTYLVRDTIDFRDEKGYAAAELVIQGAGQSRTIIRLVDRAVGFLDPTAPRAVVRTNSLYAPGVDAPAANVNGTGNKAFRNAIYDLTIDTGAGNPGAQALDFLGNHRSAIRRVTLRTSDPQGAGVVGLALDRAPGPLMVERLTVEGFDVGIDVAGREYGVTFEHLRLARQRTLGVRVTDNVVAIRGLHSMNAVPVLKNETKDGLVSVVDAWAAGGTGSATAFANEGALYARNIHVEGYAAAITERGTPVPGLVVTEHVSEPAKAAFPPARESPVPPFDEVPQAFQTDPAAWAVIQPGSGDDAAALQRALDGGASAVLLAPGTYELQRTVRVPSGVRQVFAMEAYVVGVGGPFTDAAAPAPLFRFESGSDAVTVDRMIVQVRDGSPGVVPFENASPRPLVLRDSILDCPTRCVSLAPGAGSLVLDDVAGDRWRFPAAARVSARALVASADDVAIESAGTLAVLGLYSQSNGTVLAVQPGGVARALGVLSYPRQTPATPAFTIDDGEAAFSYAVSVYVGSTFDVQVAETRLGVTRSLAADGVTRRGLGSLVPLYVGR